ncbi:MAG: OsmC family protein [Humidesulfovibrio sp.]|uniref:sulfurtransferase TusA family protein n=1 Tax=Humidesulfovibrio sp. TaxID=2910988 RepID=UPI0027FDEBB7|nr:OsmC family protein [Humidesulfovibrio sp.]MDQ7835993.1 OsmC family protein [Humidesulfovibrio sp.]
MTAASTPPPGITPDVVFDGGDLDCGSGLVLMIREHMLLVPVGGVLEMKSSEPTVADDLPPWCRMAGHEYLGHAQGAAPGQAPGVVRYFVRRGAQEQLASEAKALADDKAKAKAYVWRLRTRATGHQKATVYCRNFSWDLGQSASFEEKDAHPSAVEALLGALGGSLATAYATECARRGLELDDIELTVAGRLANVLAHLGMEVGDPSFADIEVKCYASSLDDEAAVRSAFEDVVARSPIAATLKKATALTIKFAVV